MAQGWRQAFLNAAARPGPSCDKMYSKAAERMGIKAGDAAN